MTRAARLAAIALLIAGFVASATAAPLRVCADPNNLPFSNARLEGFENAVMKTLGDATGREIEWVWWAQRRGFVRNTLAAGLCDATPGVLSSAQSLRTTRPYYRSTFVFATRAGERSPASLEDDMLRHVRLGVHLVGDGAQTPAGLALARRGVVGNVRGFPIFGDYRESGPGAEILRSLLRGEIDVALVWGPFAGVARARDGARIDVTPVTPTFDGPRNPMAFDISVGVRKDAPEVFDELDAAIERMGPQIDGLLESYGVPRSPELVKR